jgi:hypothetical protein
MSAISAIPAIANAMTMKDLISAVSALTADERSEFRAILFPDAPKAGRPKKVAPAEPVLKDGWVFQPYTKGAKKGQDRWYNEAEDEHTDDRSVCFSMPAPAKAKAPVKGAEPKKRLTKEEKESMSPEEKKALKAKKAAESAERKAKRTPEEQAKIDERTAKAKATREAKKAGGSAEAPHAEEDEDGSASE